MGNSTVKSATLTGTQRQLDGKQHDMATKFDRERVVSGKVLVVENKSLSASLCRKPAFFLSKTFSTKNLNNKATNHRQHQRHHHRVSSSSVFVEAVDARRGPGFVFMLDARTFMFNGTTTFLGKHFEFGSFERDFISLKDLWDSAMHEVLGLEARVGDKFRQEVQIPWNAEVREIENDVGLMDLLSEFEQRKPNIDPIQHPNPEQEPIVLTDSSSPLFEDDANYNSYGSLNQTSIHDSEDEISNENNGVEDEVPNENNGLGDELPNNCGDENDNLSDVNEDDITEEEVVDNPIMDTTFRLRDDGRITIEVGWLFRNSTHFREVLLDYSIQEGFKLQRIKNEKRRITYGCEANSCLWRVHGSPTSDRITYILKTLTNDHNYLAVPKNRDVTSSWFGKRFELIIKENPDINIRVLGSVILRQYGVHVPDHTLYRAKKYALNIGVEDPNQSYNKLYRYGHIIMERNPESYVKIKIITNPNPQILATFERFYLSFQA
ncbi:hypothetical protein Ddye_001280 [Dipteronia dyeriana]|uniref:Transposase MuDR plant domain-containing protein n=1 Tax=Dipteronia dyeriana TaxID=168575 RepID=A0AAD9XNS8_9ROSI|nr:hypothetical protein Ddye_001280 [Dipteronia dyeriana]